MKWPPAGGGFAPEFWRKVFTPQIAKGARNKRETSCFPHAAGINCVPAMYSPDKELLP